MLDGSFDSFGACTGKRHNVRATSASFHRTREPLRQNACTFANTGLSMKGRLLFKHAPCDFDQFRMVMSEERCSKSSNEIQHLDFAIVSPVVKQITLAAFIRDVETEAL